MKSIIPVSINSVDYTILLPGALVIGNCTLGPTKKSLK